MEDKIKTDESNQDICAAIFVVDVLLAGLSLKIEVEERKSRRGRGGGVWGPAYRLIVLEMQ